MVSLMATSSSSACWAWNSPHGGSASCLRHLLHPWWLLGLPGISQHDLMCFASGWEQLWVLSVWGQTGLTRGTHCPQPAPAPVAAAGEGDKPAGRWKWHPRKKKGVRLL